MRFSSWQGSKTLTGSRAGCREPALFSNLTRLPGTGKVSMPVSFSNWRGRQREFPVGAPRQNAIPFDGQFSSTVVFAVELLRR